MNLNSDHVMRLYAVVLLTVCLSSAAASSAKETSVGLSLYELIESARSGSAARPSAVLRHGTKKSCLQSQALKNCRVLGGQPITYGDWPPSRRRNSASVLQDSEPTNTGLNVITGGHAEFDFGCCEPPNPEKYEQPQESLSDLFVQTKVGGCEFSFNLLNDYPANHYEGSAGAHFDLLPVEGNTWLKFGPASSVCSLNADAEECRGPFCDGMTITMQGGIYIALATSPGGLTQFYIPPGDACEPLGILYQEIGGNRVAGKQIKDIVKERRRKVQECVSECLVRTNGTQRAPPPAVCGCESLVEVLWESIFLTAIFNPKLDALMQEKWGPFLFSNNPERLDGNPAPSNSKLYGGLALVYMGQTTFSSIKGNLKVEETGWMEFPNTFIPLAYGVPFDPELMMVEGSHLKLWTSQEEGYGHSS